MFEQLKKLFKKKEEVVKEVALKDEHLYKIGHKIGDYILLKYITERKALWQCKCGKQREAFDSDMHLLRRGICKECHGIQKAESGRVGYAMKEGVIVGSWKIIKKINSNNYQVECIKCHKITTIDRGSIRRNKGLGCKSCWQFNPSEKVNNLKCKNKEIPINTKQCFKIGDKHGEFTVIKLLSPYEAILQCSCGKQIKNRTENFFARKHLMCLRCFNKTKKGTKYNVLPRPRNKPVTKYFPGEVYGKWTVLSIPEKIPGEPIYKRLCRCSCGAEKMIQTANLSRAKDNNGGCLSCSPKNIKSLMNLKSNIEAKKEERTPKDCAPGQQYGKWTVLSTMPGASKQAVRLCLCSCGEQKIVQCDSLRKAVFNNGGCFKCRDLKAFATKIKDAQAREQQKEIIQTIHEVKEAKVFEKLPEKLNIAIPRTEELNTYIKQAEELLKNTADIHFENRFKTQTGYLILYWGKEDKTSRFRLMAAETYGMSDIPNKPAQPLDTCDLRIKMRACNNCLKEFLELYEMHLADYLEGKNHD